jgi:hypothetical protein
MRGRFRSALGLGVATLALLACTRPSSTTGAGTDTTQTEEDSLRAKLAARGTDAVLLEGALLQALFPSGFSGDSARYLVADKLCESMAERVEAMFTIPRFFNVVFNSANPSTCDYPDLTPACAPEASCSGAVMTMVFDDCTGPFGLVDIAGTVTASMSLERSDGGEDAVVTAQVSTIGFTIGEFRFDQNITVSAPMGVQSPAPDGGSAPLATTPEPMTITLSGSLAVTDTEDGGSFTLETEGVELTVDMASQCIRVEGDITVTLETKQFPISLSGIEQCGGQCSSEGSAVVTDNGADPLTITHNGTHEPSWQTGRGSVGTTQSSCMDKPEGSGSPGGALPASTLFGTEWACTGVTGKLSFAPPGLMANGDIVATWSSDGVSSCDGDAHGAPGWVTVDNCALKDNATVAILGVTNNGCIPDYYDMLGGFAIYDSTGYWGGLPLYCEPCDPQCH